MMPVARRLGFRCDLLPRLPRAIEEAEQLVYALWDGEAIKVGRSKRHPRERMCGLPTGNPRTMCLLAYDCGITERLAHRRLWRYRIPGGEWFRPHQDVLTGTRALKRQCTRSRVEGAKETERGAMPISRHTATPYWARAGTDRGRPLLGGRPGGPLFVSRSGQKSSHTGTHTVTA
jgi:hypothetical protein